MFTAGSPDHLEERPAITGRVSIPSASEACRKPIHQGADANVHRRRLLSDAAKSSAPASPSVSHSAATGPGHSAPSRSPPPRCASRAGSAHPQRPAPAPDQCFGVPRTRAKQERLVPNGAGTRSATTRRSRLPRLRFCGTSGQDSRSHTLGHDGLAWRPSTACLTIHRSVAGADLIVIGGCAAE